MERSAPAGTLPGEDTVLDLVVLRAKTPLSNNREMITCFIAILPEPVLDAPSTHGRAISTRGLCKSGRCCIIEPGRRLFEGLAALIG
jgi:hypothetical protein